jgi:hypothetical protein
MNNFFYIIPYSSHFFDYKLFSTATFWITGGSTEGTARGGSFIPDIRGLSCGLSIEGFFPG